MEINIEHPTSNIEHPIRPRRAGFGCWVLDVGCSMFPFAIMFVFGALPLYGQTNASGTNALPALLPPYGELPPTFWEQHTTSIVVTGLGMMALVASGLWLIFRPKPKIIIPPEVQARQALEILRQQPEDGVVLSRVSQVVRNYFIAAFQLAPGEFTTAEFSRALSGHEQIGAELSTAVAGFLRDCDDQKFSTATALVPLDAANQALKLVALAEQRRTQLRQLAETQTQGRRA
jgi:hypothetical protein